MKNYNMFALEGDPSTSDVDVCQTLGLDIDLAGTPAINDAAIEAMMRQNISMMVRQGMSESEAQHQASQLADQSRKRVQLAMSKQQ